MTSVTAEWQAPRGKGLPPSTDPGRFDDPEAWGVLAEPGVHNPFSKGPLAWVRHSIQVKHGWDKAEAAAPEIVDRFHARYLHHVDNSQPAISVPTVVLRHIVRSGRMKSQFETGRSSGDYNPERRSSAEKFWFGYGEDHPDHARPIYGYLTRHPYTDDATHSYGAHTLILHKPRVWHRTTYTGADSLDNRRRIAPVPVTNRHSLHGMPLEHFDLDDEMASEMSPEEIGHHMRRFNPERIADEFWRHPDDVNDINYPEAQYHGGVSLKDVRHVILRSPENSSGMDDEVAHHAAHLTRAGIPWVHTNGWRRPVDDDPHFRPRRGGA